MWWMFWLIPFLCFVAMTRHWRREPLGEATIEGPRAGRTGRWNEQRDTWTRWSGG